MATLTLVPGGLSLDDLRRLYRDRPAVTLDPACREAIADEIKLRAERGEEESRPKVTATSREALKAEEASKAEAPAEDAVAEEQDDAGPVDMTKRTFLGRDLMIDRASGRIWRLQLDLGALASSCSDRSALAAFLQRRREPDVGFPSSPFGASAGSPLLARAGGAA